MKRVILIATAIGMMLFCMCAVAHAESFKGKCSEAPYSVTGEVEIEESGACKISHGITATGYIKIKATGAVTIEGTVDAGYGFGVTTSGNLEVTGDVATNTAGDGGNVWIKAEGEVATGSITTGGGAHAGSVQIKANQGGGSHLFTIGGSGNSNGVNGSINTSGTTAGATESIYVQDGITIENGTTSSTGGITLEAMSDLNVIQSASRSGAIVLQAQNGVLKLPSGHLSANGDTGEGAGFVQLMAKEISVESGAEITAIQEESAAATCHNVILAASTVKHGSSKLELRADGKGYEKACGGAVELVPQGAIAITYLGSNEVTYWEERTVGESSSNSLSLEGTGELVITADGKKDTVEIWGNPLKMHKTKIFAAGSENEVFIYSGTGWSSPTYNKLTFAEPVEVFASTEEKGATTNKIYVRGSEIAKPEGHVELDAAGLKGANGGTVQLVSEKGEVYLGESSSTITLNVSAFDGEGSGGTATVDAGKSTVKIAENAFFGSTFEGNSSGGALEVYGGKIESTKANVALFATGHGSGKGGRLKLQSEGTLAIGGKSGELELVLADEETGGAGTAELSASEVKVNGGYIFDTPNTAGNGAEIKVYDTGTLKISKDFPLTANGMDNGEGGTLDFEADKVEFENEEGTLKADGAGTGAGGTVIMEVNEEDPIVLAENVVIHAISGASEKEREEEKGGEGGEVVINHVIASDDEEPINPAEDVEVDPGNPLITRRQSEEFNGVRCTEWGDFKFPKTFWACNRHDPPEATEEYPVKMASEMAIEEAYKTQVASLTPTIYVFLSVTAANEFFSGKYHTLEVVGKAGDRADTWTARNKVYSAIYTEPTTGKPLVENAMREVSVHELGHEIDFAGEEKDISESNEPKKLASTKYGKYVQNDFEYLDFSKLGSTAKKSTRREPCGAGGPFEEITIPGTSEKVCPSGKLNSKFTNWYNSKIAQYLSSKFKFTAKNTIRNYPEGWPEIYAQSFAYEAFSKGISLSTAASPEVDGIFKNGYFECSREWAKSVLAKHKPQAPSPAAKPAHILGSSCEAVVEKWYPEVFGEEF